MVIIINLRLRNQFRNLNFWSRLVLIWIKNLAVFTRKGDLGFINFRLMDYLVFYSMINKGI